MELVQMGHARSAASRFHPSGAPLLTERLVPATDIPRRPVYDDLVATILVVDDDAVVRDVVARYLERDGFHVFQAGDGQRAQQLVGQSRPDLVVLDVMMPGLNGLDLCRWIRDRHHTPVILLTARAEEADRIVGLELGADDYVTKPFSPRELTARVKAVLRRASPPPTRKSPIEISNLAIDPEAREVIRSGEVVELTALEFDLLSFLADHPRVVFSREQLLTRVWGHERSVDTAASTVTVHVRRLREKIEDDPSNPALIQTVWGVGYRLVS
jgi:DNA-binding response OmpR family regulator